MLILMKADLFIFSIDHAFDILSMSYISPQVVRFSSTSSKGFPSSHFPLKSLIQLGLVFVYDIMFFSFLLVYWCPVVTTPFVLSSPVNCLCVFVKNQLALPAGYSEAIDKLFLKLTWGDKRCRISNPTLEDKKRAGRQSQPTPDVP